MIEFISGNIRYILRVACDIVILRKHRKDTYHRDEY